MRTRAASICALLHGVAMFGLTGCGNETPPPAGPPGMLAEDVQGPDVALLTAQLKSSNHRERQQAIVILGALGQRAAVAVPELEKLAADSNLEIRQMSAEAILKIKQSTAQQ